ncbi:MAG: glutamate synthase large subunit [Deltaproteobacteria bacterium]|nr:glutamate synthase large subunit [Deltaproteobacteria bacterium]
MPQGPERRGLYDPQMEHDECGVGFVAHIKGEKSRAIVEQAMEVLRRLAHRGASGCDPDTGDGAGILLQLPHRFFKREGLRLGWDMPRRRRYGVGMVFLPPDPKARAACERVFEEVVREQGQRVVGWRDVPTDPRHVGRVARSVMPFIRQIYIARRRVVPSAFERKLYVIRKLTENRIRDEGIGANTFHVASLSAETIVYKGLLLPEQVPQYFPDLQDQDMVSALALVHSRFSTNTFPTWDRAQPMRFIAHNGEINTLRGNRNWMNARRAQLHSAKFEGPLDRLFPIIVPGGSDSSQFDNMLELLTLGGRSLPHSVMMMIPEAWENDPLMDADRRAFYEYAGSLTEPWDGPAAIAFTDGQIIGATLDRNGLRPARYVVTEDDRVILASEVGVIDVPPHQIRRKGRLQPGRMFVVDTHEGRIIDDAEVKGDITGRWPYRRWLEKNVLTLDDFPHVQPPPPLRGEELQRQQRAFGYTDEDLRVIIAPMAEAGQEPTGSMGSDTPLAVLSDRAPSLFHYFKQLFAQVTNPPIDPIREALVMTLETSLGPDGNTFEETPEQCHRLAVPTSFFTNAELAKIKQVYEGALEPTTLSILYPRASGAEGLAAAVDRLCKAAVDAIDEGASIVILTDRGVDADQVPMPALLAVSAVHHHLTREGIRMHAGLVVETGEAREVHHFATLVGYGAAAVNPYVALDTVREMAERGLLPGTPEEAERRYIKAVDKGILKVMSKMGISAIQSYRGAQIFECLGLDRELVDKHFNGTVSRIEGVGLVELGREVLERHERGFGARSEYDVDALPVGGEYQWRRRGERHRWSPAAIATLQAAATTGEYARYQTFADLADDESDTLMTLRGLLEMVPGPEGEVPLEEVEPASAIVTRFATGAMSFGSISAEAHETLAIAMNRLGGRSNSGEGGEERERYTVLPNGDNRRSAIKQIASGRFGVTAEYLVNADDLQIKVAQGAKPGEGGQLPGHKVSERIARVRCSTPGVTLISPPPHHDIYSIEDLKQLIYDLKSVNSDARVSVKLVSEAGVGTVAAGVAKAGAEAVVIAGDCGGTGASPVSSLKHAGLPWELGLAETQQVLVQNDLRRRIRVQVDGGFRTGRDVVVGALLGADEFGISTAALIATGCILLRKCHENTCSVGIATQDPELRRRFTGTPEQVVNYMMMVAEDVRRHMAKLGFRTFDEMVGRVDRLRARTGLEHWKARRVDLSALLAEVDAPADVPRRQVEAQDLGLAKHLDHQVIRAAKRAIESREPVELEVPICNGDRAVGAMLSGAVARRHGGRGLPDDTLHVRYFGTAGQSFGAWLARGITFTLEGDANDYVGKGLSGGRVVVRPPAESRFVPEENIVVGNVCLYGATGGELYANGMAGERFAVRNSGARAVVEGVGDHGCEYMTGGVVVVLGATGRNFAAGMSGGMAFVFDRDREFHKLCNRSMVDLEPLQDEADLRLVHGLVEAHVHHTASPLGQRLLDNWDIMVSRFVKVMPTEYKRAMAERQSSLRPAAA